MTPVAPYSRYAEVDLLRGVAVAFMIIFHAAFDLVFFGGQQLDLDSGILWAIGRSAAVLFILLAGASMGLAWRRKHEGKKNPLLMRGIQILGMGIALTAFTWIFFHEYTIWFGVLHLIGLGVIIGIAALSRPRLTFIAGTIITGIGILLSFSAFSTLAPAIVPLVPVAFRTFDYFPLFPWMGIFLLGMSLGEHFFPSGRQRYRISINATHPLAQPLIWAGRNSLLLYFIHQPILVGAIMLLRIA
ncbi:MAG: DUF1624 domain-containing protein [Candidatus Iainarchaeum archaeon]|uniref:DUF1624 domain-containing protein n=1 Tax=Candidatus Iainarchaeum sp. TaxID=3101447 RepID=A0A7T9DK13_9ARCH|nr:MAG: DUF1624 domain-containing protein [Candidatus Diapherotrites archaeon]